MTPTTGTRVGVPRELKDNEFRVAITPAGAHALVEAGHTVLVESQAGAGSGFADDRYRAAGATIVPTRADVYRDADLVVKVKEPLPEERSLLQPGQVLFAYLHLAASEDLTRALIDRGVSAVAYETVQLASGSLPLLAPMSEIAGRMAVQVAAHFLEREHGGAGKLLSGVPGVPSAEVVVIGAGAVGTNATQIALGMGAHVVVVDRNLERLRYLDLVLHGSLTTLAANPLHIAEAVAGADVAVGAVLVPGAKAPRVVTREVIARMRPGSVVVDVAIDQGGCFETSRPTTHSHPTYLVDGVVHYCVTNMPGAVPHTSTLALTNATLPYVLELANKGLEQAIADNPELARGLNVHRGSITHETVAAAFGLECRPPRFGGSPRPTDKAA